MGDLPRSKDAKDAERDGGDVADSIPLNEQSWPSGDDPGQSSQRPRGTLPPHEFCSPNTSLLRGLVLLDGAVRHELATGAVAVPSLSFGATYSSRIG